MEHLFDSNDIPKNPKMEPLKSNIEECNIGSEENPKIIKLSKSLPPNEKLKYMELIKEFQDVFSWSYEDLKSYDTSIIQHTIPLKEDQSLLGKSLEESTQLYYPLLKRRLRECMKQES